MDQGVKAVERDMNIKDGKDSFWSLRRRYTNALRAAEYAKTIEENPYIDINYVLRKLRPVQLYQRMLDIKAWRKNENFRKGNFNRFVRVQADKLETEQRRAPVTYERHFEKENHPVRASVHFLNKKSALEKTAPSVVKQQ